MKTNDGKLAQNFPEAEDAMAVVEQRNIKNAELVTLNDWGKVTGGRPLRISKYAPLGGMDGK